MKEKTKKKKKIQKRKKKYKMKKKTTLRDNCDGRQEGERRVARSDCKKSGFLISFLFLFFFLGLISTRKNLRYRLEKNWIKKKKILLFEIVRFVPRAWHLIFDLSGGSLARLRVFDSMSRSAPTAREATVRACSSRVSPPGRTLAREKDDWESRLRFYYRLKETGREK